MILLALRGQFCYEETMLILDEDFVKNCRSIREGIAATERLMDSPVQGVINFQEVRRGLLELLLMYQLMNWEDRVVI